MMGQHTCYKEFRNRRNSNMRNTIKTEKAYFRSLKNEEFYDLVNKHIDSSAMSSLLMERAYTWVDFDWELRTHKGSSWKKSCMIKRQYDKGKRAYNYSFKNSAKKQYEDSWNKFNDTELEQLEYDNPYNEWDQERSKN